MDISTVTKEEISESHKIIINIKTHPLVIPSRNQKDRNQFYSKKKVSGEIFINGCLYL